MGFGFWEFVLLVVVVSALASVIRTAIENDRATKLAKVEANLKLKLVERLGDPELVRRVIEARLPVDTTAEVARTAEGGERAPEPTAAETEKKEKSEVRSAHVLAGLICFLVGCAFIVARLLGENKSLIIPGLICVAVGLAFLTFATSQRQILKQTSVGQET